MQDAVMMLRLQQQIKQNLCPHEVYLLVGESLNLDPDFVTC